jgi:VanZ family protein
MKANQLQAVRVNKKKKSTTTPFVLKIIIIFLWGLFLLLNTWAESLEHLLDFQSLGFRWVSTPNFRSFFYFYDLTLVHKDYLIVKIGHFLGFAIMDLLIFNLLKNHKYSIAIAIIFAFITEFLQMFFGRDGRLYDLIIDSLGVLSVFLILKKIRI